jgi:hypothetical protein
VFVFQIGIAFAYFNILYTILDTITLYTIIFPLHITFSLFILTILNTSLLQCKHKEKKTRDPLFTMPFARRHQTHAAAHSNSNSPSNNRVTTPTSVATLQQFNNHNDDRNKQRGIDYCLQMIIPRKLHTATPLFVRCLMVSLTFFVIWFQIFDQQLSSSLSVSTQDYSQQPIIRNLNRGSNSTGSIEGIKPKILPIEDRSKHHLFVHIGKAGGSSIWVMVKKSREKCKELSMMKDDDNNNNNNRSLLLLKTQVCALATIPDGRVHFNERLHPQKSYSKYTQFFINVRDPIDRLISWYNYEILSFKKEPRWTTANETGQASDNFRRLSQLCFPDKNGFTNMVNGGLLLLLSSSSSSNNDVVKTTNKENDASSTTDCNELARLCLRGDIMCFGHNYYNYEVYLEEILLRKGFSTGNTISSENNNIDSNIRIDVLRSEHSMDDFNRTVGLWTINNNSNSNNNKNEKIEEFVGITQFVQGLYGRVRTIQDYDKHATTKNDDNDDDGILSLEASSALCKHICTELIVYKLILKASNNLYGSEIRDSYNALDERCGFIVDDICGTEWTYRDIKTKKNVFDAPW